MEEKDIDQKSIRTYESDVANAIQHHGTSQASMVVAAQEKKHAEEKVFVVNSGTAQKKQTSWVKNILMILGSLILLAAGVGAAYYFYTISPLSVQQPVTPAATSTPIISTSIIRPDLQKVTDITNQNSSGILAKIEQQAQANVLPNGGILELILGIQASTTTQNGKTTTNFVRVTGPQFISLLGLTPPNALTSTLTNQWMIGFYSPAGDASTTNQAPFVVLTENFFQNAFAGMLGWEPTMAPDLSSLFGIPSAELVGGGFHDKLIKNKNVREYIDGSGNVLFLYSFINNGTLVIAQNETTLSALVDKFESQAYVR